MKLEYQNGIRLTKHLHEMTPLEIGISRYEEMANQHFSNFGDPATPIDAERQAEKDEALKHLATEKRQLKTLYKIQAKLDEYREAGLKATTGSNTERRAAISAMEAEEHHPTKTLERYMRAEGTPKPSARHTAHHIVPGKGKLKELTADTRYHLHIHGIRINDPANGVYLVSSDKYAPHWSMPLSRGHKKYHLHEYERVLNEKITLLENIDFIKTQLQIIARMLQANEPKEAINKMASL